MNKTPINQKSGFTLIELIVTIAIIGVVSGIAIPSFIDMVNSNRLASVTNELVGALNYTRSESVKRGKQVTMCRSNNAGAASPTCTTGTPIAWQNGWLIFMDEASGTLGTFDSGTDVLLKASQEISNTAAITPDTQFNNYVSYLPSGLAKGSNLGTGTISVCVKSKKRGITINVTGRIIVKRYDTC